MILQAGDLGFELDTGTNVPGEILQRLDDGEWQYYLVDGKPARKSQVLYFPLRLGGLLTGGVGLLAGAILGGRGKTAFFYAIK
jgi:hypothetical protein